MRCVDRILMRWRFRQALPWVQAGADVLDIGCHQGNFFRFMGGRLRSGIGFDPLAAVSAGDRVRLIAETFRVPSPRPGASFDAAVLIAALKHMPDKDGLPPELFRLGGRVVLTVPSPFLDALIGALRWQRLADCMSTEEHHGFAPKATPDLFFPTEFTLEYLARIIQPSRE